MTVRGHAGNAAWIWVDAAFNVDVGNNDEFVASLLPEAIGADYTYRATRRPAERDWVYADLDGSPNRYSSAQAGALTVVSSGDTTAPAVPGGLHVVAASPDGIELAWNAVAGDATLYGYEVRRAPAAAAPTRQLALTTTPSYTDADVEQGATYYYVVRSVDLSFNRSADSPRCRASAQLRTVTVIFTATVPANTDGTGRNVHRRHAHPAGRRAPGLGSDRDGADASRRDALDDHADREGGPQIEYKYALASWDFVEGAAGEPGTGS